MGIYTPQNGITVKKGAVLRLPVYPGVSDDTGLRAGGKTPFSTAFCILPDMFPVNSTWHRLFRSGILYTIHCGGQNEQPAAIHSF